MTKWFLDDFFYKINTDKFYNNNNPINDPFIISLKKDITRYNSASQIIKSLGMTPMKFPAINGKKIVKKYPLLSQKFKLKPGEIGCFLSHLTILYIASKHPNQNQYTLIFEDDINTLLNKDSFNDNIDKILLPAINANMVYLGKCLERCEKLKRISKNIYYGYSPLCTHAYLIKNSFARKIINNIRDTDRDFYLAYDIFLILFMANNKIIVFHPSLFFQDCDYNSNLRNNKEKYKNLLECKESLICPNKKNNSSMIFLIFIYSVFFILLVLLFLNFF